MLIVGYINITDVVQYRICALLYARIQSGSLCDVWHAISSGGFGHRWFWLWQSQKFGADVTFWALFTQLLALFVNHWPHFESWKGKIARKQAKKAKFGPISRHFETCHILVIRHLSQWPVTRSEFRTGQRACDAWRPDWIRAYSTIYPEEFSSWLALGIQSRA